jgi:hypothetical protein
MIKYLKIKMASTTSNELTPEEKRREEAITAIKRKYGRALGLLYPHDNLGFYSETQLKKLTEEKPSIGMLVQTLGEPSIPSSHYTALERWPRILRWYRSSCFLDLTPEQARALSQTDDPREVVGIPINAMKRADIERFLAEQRDRYPSGRPRGYGNRLGNIKRSGSVTSGERLGFDPKN